MSDRDLPAEPGGKEHSGTQRMWLDTNSVWSCFEDRWMCDWGKCELEHREKGQRSARSSVMLSVEDWREKPVWE